MQWREPALNACAVANIARTATITSLDIALTCTNSRTYGGQKHLTACIFSVVKLVFTLTVDTFVLLLCWLDYRNFEAVSSMK
jgi:hypothetical protein